MRLNSKYWFECQKGCDAFNRGDPWQAHEHWETAWKTLPAGAPKRSLQACIQIAAAIHLSWRGRQDPADRLVRLAFSKWLGVRGRSGGPKLWPKSGRGMDLASWVRRRSREKASLEVGPIVWKRIFSVKAKLSKEMKWRI